MLPKAHQHDIKWIREQLSKLPVASQQVARDGYERVFTESYHAEPNEMRKENAARFAANTRLRQFVENHATHR